jgi:hypothetical protein
LSTLGTSISCEPPGRFVGGVGDRSRDSSVFLVSGRGRLLELQVQWEQTSILLEKVRILEMLKGALCLLVIRTNSEDALIITLRTSDQPFLKIELGNSVEGFRVLRVDREDNFVDRNGLLIQVIIFLDLCGSKYSLIAFSEFFSLR